MDRPLYLVLFYLTLPISLAVIFAVLLLLWIWTLLVVTAYHIRFKLTGTPPPSTQWPSPDDPTNT